MAGNKSCNKEGHGTHICSLKEQKFDIESPDEFRAMTEDPEYKCENCGATAKKSEFLCEPVKL